MPFPRPLTLCLLASLGQALAAQTPAQWIEDLGDSGKGEAAERQLLKLGGKASEPLLKLFDDWADTTPRERERLRAALRVVDLLGPDAAPLAASLSAAAKGERKDLALPLIDARASLCPYAMEEPWHEQFHRGINQANGSEKAAQMVAFYRHAARSGVPAQCDVAQAKALLEKDGIFAREVAAEVLGAAGDRSAIDLLSRRLAARDRRPEGHDSLRHNGFPLPVDDRFVLRASDALIRLAPDDPRCAIAYACRAVVHPHRATRLQALHDLGRFGPEVGSAAPELLVVAQGADDELATEALKVLGMAGREVAPFLQAIEALVARGGTVGRLAGSILSRLRAMGIAPAAAPVAADPALLAALDAAVAAIADRNEPAIDTAIATLRAQPELAWPRLMERFRRDYRTTPDRALQLLGELAPARQAPDRDLLRFAIASLSSDNWHAPMMACYTGGETLRPLHAVVYGEAVLGNATAMSDLLAGLGNANVAVGLAAARRLASRHAEIAGAVAAGQRQAMDALLLAVDSAPATRAQWEIAPGDKHEVECDAGAALHAAAACALADCELPPERQATLLPLALAHDDEAVVAVAVAAWGAHADIADLERAARDARPSIAAAARKALADRPGK